MKRRILSMAVALAALAGSVTAQTLSVAPMEAETGSRAELVVTADGFGADVTALQFNLTLPEGITLDEAAIAKGSGVSSHTLSVSELAGGDRLFVLYSMNLNKIANGELLRLPVTVGAEATTATGKLTTIRYATTDAVSHAVPDADALVVGIHETKAATKGNTEPSWFTLGGQRLSTEPVRKGIYVNRGQKVVVN